MSETAMLLTLDKVTRFYGSRLVFKDLSLSVGPGTVTLLTGANGAGKTTLLRIMAGLIRPSAGSVILGAGQRNPMPASEKHGAASRDGAPVLGFLGHQTFLYPDLSARENLRFWSALHDRACSDDALDDALRRVELESFAEEKAGTFSRGMAQRLNLARVFLLQPDILLLDEPGTGLDTRSALILHREIMDARAQGAGIVWITHSPDDDLGCADMVAVLANKGLRFYGTSEVYREQRLTPPRRSFSSSPYASGGELC